MRETSKHFCAEAMKSCSGSLPADVVAFDKQPSHLSAISAIRKTFVILSITTLPFMTACVGSTVSSTLDSAALESPTQLLGEEDAYVSDFTTVAALPVPARSPKSSQLALAGDDTIPALDAVNAIANGGAEDAQTDTQLAVTSSEEDEDTVAETRSTTNAESQTVALGTTGDTGVETGVNVPVPSPAAAVGSGGTSNATGTDTTATKQLAKKPVGFWGALFGSKPKKQMPASNTQIARATPNTAARTTASNSGSALPGVKRSSAIFGISEDERNKPLSDSQENVQVASVGSFGRYQMVNGLVLQTESVKVDCFKPELMKILRVVERRYGKKVMVTSGYRSPQRNRRAGGVQNSSHIYCKAADIQVEGVSKWDLAKFLRTVDGRGGVGTYCRTESVHIDTGSVRDWHHPCRRSSSRVKKKA